MTTVVGTDPIVGVDGQSTGESGESVYGAGVRGVSTGNPIGIGIDGSCNSGTGVRGGSESGTGVVGTSISGTGVVGTSISGTGVSGGGAGIGIFGNSTNVDGIGVDGFSSSGTGVRGSSTNGVGVGGRSDRVGVYGESTNGNGVVGVIGEHGYAGVYGYSHNKTRYAGYFIGNVHVTGTLSKGGLAFKIDHPLDPANKYLLHSGVESPDMKNIYDGVVVLDANGEAIVDLPAWFEALNSEIRYQLTSIGAPGPNLYIAEEISNQRFKIAGGKPGMKVCWQVTGSRKDAWAQANPLIVEQEKSATERGRYLHPEVYGLSREQSIAWLHHPEGLRRAVEE